MGPLVPEILQSREAIENKMTFVIFSFGRVHFATIGGKSVMKDQVALALLYKAIIRLRCLLVVSRPPTQKEFVILAMLHSPNEYHL